MSDTLINMPSASRPILPTDLLYLVRGTGADRDKKTDPRSLVADSLAPAIDSLSPYNIGLSSLEYQGEVVLVTAGLATRLDIDSLKTPGYAIPGTGLLSPKWKGASGPTSFDDSTSFFGTIAMAQIGGLSSFQAAWSVGFGTLSIAKSVIASSSRTVSLFVATESVATPTLAQRIATVFAVSIATTTYPIAGTGWATNGASAGRPLFARLVKTTSAAPWDPLDYDAFLVEFYKHDNTPYTYAEMLADIGAEASETIRFSVSTLA